MKIGIMIIILTTVIFASQEYIISDYDYTNQEYTFQEVWKFTRSFKNTALTYDNVAKLVSWCTVYQINPIFVLTRMQMESDLLVRSMPLTGGRNVAWLKERAMGYGLYLHVWRDGLKFYKYGGYDIQVFKGIELMRRSFDRWKPGKKVYIKDLKKEVIPNNAATYAQYEYTPFYGVHNLYGWENEAIGNKHIEDLFPQYKKRWNNIIVSKRKEKFKHQPLKEGKHTKGTIRVDGRR